MDSHTVPAKLLKQFAFRDPVKELRLWRYRKGREPDWDVSPTKATVISGHFSDPLDTAREERTEAQLNQRFENSVHVFREQLGYRTFVFGAYHASAPASFIALLWHRSRARKAVTNLHAEISIEALEKLKARTDLLERIAASWTLDCIRHGARLQEAIGPDKAMGTIDTFIARFIRPGRQQTSCADTMEGVMTDEDTTFDNAQWGVVHTEPDRPFVLGHAPVVTRHCDRTGIATAD
jgi:Protein of unknown function (DUF4238)